MALKAGREEIEYLLGQVFKKYEAQTGSKLNLNTNRRNYEEIARILSEISNQLPYTAEKLGHSPYPEDRNAAKTEYPYQKYDVTGGQIKDAFNGLVAKPRPFLIDACYIYLYGMGRNRFEENVTDPNLLVDAESQIVSINKAKAINFRRLVLPLILLVLLALVSYQWLSSQSQLATLRKDLVITPYQPTAKEIEKLEGVWVVYIGSPQARKSDSNRFHKFVRNIMSVKYKDGYFVFNRYGAGFDHYGYMQYESPDVVSIRSYVKGADNKIEAPRLSLMRLSGNADKVMVVSASWNFDAGINNDIIGIREVYIKQGNGGEIKEVINTIDNHACNCKIIQWKTNKVERAFYLRNEFLDTIKDDGLKKLIDEHSILLRYPDSVTILKK
ncbi:hypothetical protein [Nubsella zeaxanthinifaciens]|uniref:hypothetical protein n=1 Tax=Nubsella zeaxanthinifaciens TaxID=392412 RepID=UPI000DE3FF63|nr:hypothetical protein [Nubsella zeaxanthinifaciens]